MRFQGRNAAALFTSVALMNGVEATQAFAAGPTPTCGGETATIVGTPGADRLRGTDRSDVIVAGEGADVIRSLGGADEICAGGGDDIVKSGPSDDVVDMGAGSATAATGSGDDELTGFFGSLNGVSLGAGADLMEAELPFLNGETNVVAGDGADRVLLFSKPPNVANVSGGDGDDEVQIPFDGVAEGGSGSDTLRGPTLIGGGDDDTLELRTGSVALVASADGGAGDDRITDSFDSESIYGGEGADRIESSFGTDVIEAGGGDDRVTTGAFSEASQETTYGGSGDDILIGGGIVEGESGDDRITTGTDVYDDRAHGGSGDDIMTELGATPDTRMWGDDGNDRMSGGTGDDYLWGGDGADDIDGGDGEDILQGADGDDVIEGGPGDSDLASGNSGNDFLACGNGGQDEGDGGAGDNDQALDDCELIYNVP